MFADVYSIKTISISSSETVLGLTEIDFFPFWILKLLDILKRLNVDVSREVQLTIGSCFVELVTSRVLMTSDLVKSRLARRCDLNLFNLAASLRSVAMFLSIEERT